MKLPNHFTLWCSVPVKLWVSHVHLPEQGEKVLASSAMQGTLQFLMCGGCLAQLYPLGKRDGSIGTASSPRVFAVMGDSLEVDLNSIAALSGSRVPISSVFCSETHCQVGQILMEVKSSSCCLAEDVGSSRCFLLRKDSAKVCTGDICQGSVTESLRAKPLCLAQCGRSHCWQMPPTSTLAPEPFL